MKYPIYALGIVNIYKFLNQQNNNCLLGFLLAVMISQYFFIQNIPVAIIFGLIISFFILRCGKTREGIKAGVVIKKIFKLVKKGMKARKVRNRAKAAGEIPAVQVVQGALLVGDLIAGSICGYCGDMVTNAATYGALMGKVIHDAATYKERAAASAAWDAAQSLEEYKEKKAEEAATQIKNQKKVFYDESDQYKNYFKENFGSKKEGRKMFFIFQEYLKDIWIAKYTHTETAARQAGIDLPKNGKFEVFEMASDHKKLDLSDNRIKQIAEATINFMNEKKIGSKEDKEKVAVKAIMEVIIDEVEVQNKRGGFETLDDEDEVNNFFQNKWDGILSNIHRSDDYGSKESAISFSLGDQINNVNIKILKGEEVLKADRETLRRDIQSTTSGRFITTRARIDLKELSAFQTERPVPLQPGKDHWSGWEPPTVVVDLFRYQYDNNTLQWNSESEPWKQIAVTIPNLIAAREEAAEWTSWEAGKVLHKPPTTQEQQQRVRESMSKIEELINKKNYTDLVKEVVNWKNNTRKNNANCKYLKTGAPNSGSDSYVDFVGKGGGECDSSGNIKHKKKEKETYEKKVLQCSEKSANDALSENDSSFVHEHNPRVAVNWKNSDTGKERWCSDYTSNCANMESKDTAEKDPYGVGKSMAYNVWSFKDASGDDVKYACWGDDADGDCGYCKVTTEVQTGDGCGADELGKCPIKCIGKWNDDNFNPYTIWSEDDEKRNRLRLDTGNGYKDTNWYNNYNNGGTNWYNNYKSNEWYDEEKLQTNNPGKKYGCWVKPSGGSEAEVWVEGDAQMLKGRTCKVKKWKYETWDECPETAGEGGCVEERNCWDPAQQVGAGTSASATFSLVPFLRGGAVTRTRTQADCTDPTKPKFDATTKLCRPWNEIDCTGATPKWDETTNICRAWNQTDCTAAQEWDQGECRTRTQADCKDTNKPQFDETTNTCRYTRTADCDPSGSNPRTGMWVNSELPCQDLKQWDCEPPTELLDDHPTLGKKYCRGYKQSDCNARERHKIGRSWSGGWTGKLVLTNAGASWHQACRPRRQSDCDVNGKKLKTDKTGCRPWNEIDCTGATPKWDETTNICRAWNQTDCTAAQEWDQGECRTRTQADCTDPTKPKLDDTTNTCRAWEESDCTDSTKPKLDLNWRVWRGPPCRAWSKLIDCMPGEVLNNNNIGCRDRTQADCANTRWSDGTSTPKLDATTKLCRPWNEIDCTGATPKWDEATNTCRAWNETDCEEGQVLKEDGTGCVDQQPQCDEKVSGYRQRDYRGCQDKTMTGRTCQRWDEQSPHRHGNHKPSKGADNHNYCRNPSNTYWGLWCYTTDPNKRWEYCDPKCPDGDETISGYRERNYGGCQNKTVTGKTCQRWDEQSPHGHSRTPQRYSHKGIGNHNYCRNPDNSRHGIWCYTNETQTRWEYCDSLNAEQANENPNCENAAETIRGYRQRDYRGCQNKTVSGKTCQNWTSHEHNPHHHITPESRPNKGLGDHNYCRNPDNSSGGIWCYTTDPNKRWEYCDQL